MDNVVKFFDTIDISFKRNKIVTICACLMAGVISLGSLVFAAVYVSSHLDNIYILDGYGGAVSASLNRTEVDRELEIQDHVTRFHELLFNLSPSNEAITRNIDRALVMSDRSAFDYYNDQSERGYYSRLIQANITQQIMIDSVSVNMRSYPYQERTYGKLYIIRESNITLYDFVSQGQLVDIGRSKNNPHGLMLERFQVVRNDKLETRKRN